MNIASRFWLSGLLGCALLLVFQSHGLAQQDAIEAELRQINGHWRVVSLVENGSTIPEDQMRYVIPGGGIMEIVDMAIIFKSPMDGHKEIRGFRIDPASYPKQIAIFQRDTTTGAGIYKFDQGKLVVCISRNTSRQVSEFKAPHGSNQTLIVLERFDPGNSQPVPGCSR